jgi:hypothetical protein
MQEYRVSNARNGGQMSTRRILFLFLAALFFSASTLPAMAAADPAPCAANASARQLDFWLGDWSVDSGRGRSTVQLSLDKCLLIESWASNTSDHRGENVIAYNSDEKTWYGLFVDNRGRAHSMSGAVAPGAAEFRGPGRDESDAPVLKRVRIVQVNPDTVDQVWEKSANNGAQWTTEFKMEYIRKKP